MRGRGGLAVLALLSSSVVANVANVAKAEAPSPLPLELMWDAPAGCPDSGTVVRRVEQILLGPPPATTLVIAKAKIVGAGAGRFELTLTLRTADVEETRAIDASSCSALAEAAAVVIALAIDPSKQGSGAELGAGVPPLPSPREPQPATPAAALPSPPPAPPRAPPPLPTRPATRVALGLGAAIESGTLPALAAGVDVSAALRVERFRIGMHGMLWLRQHAIFDEATGAGASFDMVHVGAFGGYLVPVGAFAFGPCADLEAAFVRVEGAGIRAPRSSWTSWPSIVAGARGEARLSARWGVFARADLVFPIAAPTFTLAASGSAVRLHDPALPAPRFTVGGEVVLP